MKRSLKLEELMGRVKAGRVYRRAELAFDSKSIDRHLAALVKSGRLRKLQGGLYTAPIMSTFGELPPDEQSLLRTFLKDDHFVVYSYNSFNELGFGTTQIHDRRVVFNRKRSGEHVVGGKTYLFHKWREAPKVLSEEFLVVELLNNLNHLAEDRAAVLSRLPKRLQSLDLKKLKKAAAHYGTYSTQLKLSRLTESKVS